MSLGQILTHYIGKWWLSGPKYRLSAFLAGAAWKVPMREALAAHGLDLASVRTLEDVVRLFRPRWRWLPDPAFQGWDVVYPPVKLLARGGDDCDGWAMAHAQAIEEALGPYGWEARIVTYLADPWTLSHHFAVAIDPSGRLWAVQPQPGRDQPEDLDPLVRVSFTSFEDAARTIASAYGAEVVWFDVRHPDWTPA